MNYQTARIVLDVFHKARAMLDAGLFMRTIKEELLRSQLVDGFPEGGETVAIYERLTVCRSKKKFLEALDGFTESTIAPAFNEHARRLAEIRAYNEERAELTVDQAYDKALEQEADLRGYFLKQSRPNSGIRADSETMKRAIVYAHEEALEMDKARGVPPFPGVKAASLPPMPPMPPMPGIKPLPVAVSADAAVYLSGALQIGDRIEVLYGKGQSEEIRRVYQLVSLPVRVANTCYQIFLATQIGDHRVHRIAFNATIDGWELFGRKEDN